MERGKAKEESVRREESVRKEWQKELFQSKRSFFLDPTPLLDNNFFFRCEYMKCLLRGEFFE